MVPLISPMEHSPRSESVMRTVHHEKRFIRPILILLGSTFALAAWAAAVHLWTTTHNGPFTCMVAGMGFSLGPCLALYAALPRKRKPMARKLILFTGGATGLVFSLWAGLDLHLEGFFLLVLSGTGGAALGHVLITVILGPVLFGRVWCGWGCWNAMVLDLMPFRRSQGRAGQGWGRLSYFVLLASFLFVLVARFAFGHRAGGAAPEILWVLGGFVFYYVLAIGAALVFQDNRAFCKYFCPASAILRNTSRVSILKIAGDPAHCNSCQLCVRACPMDIRIPEYIQSGRRVLSGECIQCRACVNACPAQCLKWSVGLDAGGPGLPADAASCGSRD